MSHHHQCIKAVSSLRLRKRPLIMPSSYPKTLVRPSSLLGKYTSCDVAQKCYVVSSANLSSVAESIVASTTSLPDTEKQMRRLLEEKLPGQAQEIFFKQHQQQQDGGCSAREMGSLILQSWLDLQESLLNRSYSESNKNLPDRTLLQQICQAAEQAHLVLEFMYPFLAASNNHKNSLYNSIISNNNTIVVANKHRPYDITATAHCDAVLEAWSKAARAGQILKKNSRLTRGIPQRAQFLLDQMHFCYNNATKDQKEESTVVKPTVQSYNLVLTAWMHSHEHLRANMAERLFQRLNSKACSSRPDRDSYRIIIQSWATSKEQRAAFTATGHLMKMLRQFDKGNEDMEPTLEDYKSIFKAWTTAEDKSSPGKAMSVLRLMDQAFQKEATTVEPDYDCFRFLLQTAASRPLLPDLGIMVDDILKRMTDRLMVPDTECFDAAIRTWKNAALNPDLVDFSQQSVQRVLDLLAQKQVASQQSTAVMVESTRGSIHDAMEALTVSTDPRRMEFVEDFLHQLENGIDHEDIDDDDFIQAAKDPVSNARSYVLVMKVLMTSKSTDKVPRAKSILWRMEERFTKLQARKENTVDDFVGVFNAFIRVCASTETASSDRANEILAEALGAIESMRQFKNLRPNADTFTAVLEACDRLLTVGPERARIIGQVFRHCCENGMVDDCVLVQLKVSVTPEQYYQLVISRSEDFEGQRVVPEVWTHNSLQGRVITADGRKTKPLTVEGNLAVTKSMLDFRMRRLADKRNRNLLRGGRLAPPEKTVNAPRQLA